MTSPSNPSHLLVDTDSLIQILLARHRGVLGKLRESCGTRAAVVPEVEREVRNHRKFRQQFEPEFLRAVDAKQLCVLERPELKRLLSERGVQGGAVEAELATLFERCIDYNQHVDEGEAYTHAVATSLALPVMSHDRKALDLLMALGKAVGSPTLRFFDILTFALHCDWIEETKFEKTRKYLKQR